MRHHAVGRANRALSVAQAPAGSRIFRRTRAYRHDVERPRIDADRVAADWALMYHWLQHDEEMAEVCGFAPADLAPHVQARRIADLRREVGPLGDTFTVLPQEMEFWVRFSWIGADRCSGRQHALQRAVVRYLPEVETAEAMLRAAVEHGDIAMDAPVPPQTVVTVLGAPAGPDQLGPMFPTEQLLRPAGYRREDWTWLGDGGYRYLTDWVLRIDPDLVHPAVGYPDGTFDALPMIAVGREGDVAVGTCPPPNSYLVDIPWPVHPDGEGESRTRGPFACWPAVPLQTNFDLDIAGQRYCVIFNGWYVDEEIAANFLDPHRYNWMDRIGDAIHDLADVERLRQTDRLDEYRIAQIEIATLRAVRRGFKTARRKLNNLGPSQRAFGKFHERYVATHGEPPPNDTGWTANRFGSRYRHASHAMPHVRQMRGASLVKHWLTFRSLSSGIAVDIVNLSGRSERRDDALPA